jgi:hypothetical protein
MRQCRLTIDCLEIRHPMSWRTFHKWGTLSEYGKRNERRVVVVSWQNPERNLPGISPSFVRQRSQHQRPENSLELIQAGEHNRNKINVRIGFENHPGA